MEIDYIAGRNVSDLNSDSDAVEIPLLPLSPRICFFGFHFIHRRHIAQCFLLHGAYDCHINQVKRVRKSNHWIQFSLSGFFAFSCTLECSHWLQKWHQGAMSAVRMLASILQLGRKQCGASRTCEQMNCMLKTNCFIGPVKPKHQWWVQFKFLHIKSHYVDFKIKGNNYRSEIDGMSSKKRLKVIKKANELNETNEKQQQQYDRRRQHPDN